MTFLYILLSLLLGLACGAAGFYFFQKPRLLALESENARLLKEEQAASSLREQNTALAAANARLEEQTVSLEKQRVLVEKNFSEIAATYKAQFADLASKILDEKSKGLESKTPKYCARLPCSWKPSSRKWATWIA